MIAGRDALSRYLKRTAALALLLALTPAAAAAQQGRLATGNWTRGLVGGWGHSWTPGYGKTKSDVQFVAFHPQLGRFVTNHLELYGEGTLFLYSQPETAVGGGRRKEVSRFGWAPLFHKRMEYRGEGEVRAVLPGPPLKKGYQTNLDIRLDPDVAKQQGRYIPVNLEILVQEVVLPPHAAPWFAQIVKSVVHQSPVRARVTRSAIESPPHESDRRDTG